MQIVGLFLVLCLTVLSGFVCLVVVVVVVVCVCVSVRLCVCVVCIDSCVGVHALLVHFVSVCTRSLALIRISLLFSLCVLGMYALHPCA